MTVSYDAELQHRLEAEVEVEAGILDFHELESDVASQQGCYSPVSSVSDMEPSADHGTWPTSQFYRLENTRKINTHILFIQKPLYHYRD